MERNDSVELKNNVTGVVFHLTPEEAKRILDSREGDDYEILSGNVEIKKSKSKTKSIKEMVVSD